MLDFLTDTVPVGLETYYTQQEDGKFRLQVQGVVPETEYTAVKEKNKEFRDNNVNLLKQNTSLKNFEQVFGTSNLNPDAIQSKIEELATRRAESLVTEMKTKYDSKVSELETGLNAKSTKLSKLVLGDEVRRAGSKHGVVATAYDDVLRRAESDFEVTDNGVKFKQEKLDSEGKPYTIDSWMAEQAKAAPHLFATSSGTSATNSLRKQVPTSDKTQLSGPDRIAAGLQKAQSNGAARLN